MVPLLHQSVVKPVVSAAHGMQSFFISFLHIAFCMLHLYLTLLKQPSNKWKAASVTPGSVWLLSSQLAQNFFDRRMIWIVSGDIYQQRKVNRYQGGPTSFLPSLTVTLIQVRRQAGFLQHILMKGTIHSCKLELKPEDKWTKQHARTFSRTGRKVIDRNSTCRVSSGWVSSFRT